jgi:hypothetical protein
MSAFPWDDYANSGEYFTFKEVGDQVVGVIKVVRQGSDFNQNPCPELILEQDDGEEITVTAGQVLLKAALAEKAPQAGDKIRITYSGIGDARPGRAPAKLFTVEVKPGPHEVVQPIVRNDETPF